VDLVSFVPDYSGVAVPESHRVPFFTNFPPEYESFFENFIPQKLGISQIEDFLE